MFFVPCQLTATVAQSETSVAATLQVAVGYEAGDFRDGAVAPFECVDFSHRVEQ